MLLPLPPVQKIVEPGANKHATPNTAKPPHRPMVAIPIEQRTLKSFTLEVEPPDRFTS